jgi:cytoskeletal protein RodZ
VVFVGIPLALVATLFFLTPQRQASSEPTASYAYSEDQTEQVNETLPPAEVQEQTQQDQTASADEGLPENSNVSPAATGVDALRPDHLTPAVAAALDTGKPTVVDVGARSWPVLVSDPVEAGGETCRNVSIADRQATWCRKEGSDWMVAQ